MINVNNDEINLLEEEWDILIILDACRYDTFEEVYKKILKRKGELKKAKTFSNGTKEWMDGNIKGMDCSDIIYIDPIIMFDMWLPNNTFFEVDRVWKYGWNYYYGTILPRQMTDSALKQMKKHPNKRIIVHYHQPHPPFLDPAFRKIVKNIVTPELVINIMSGKVENKTNDLSNCIQRQMMRVLGSERAWKCMIKLGIEPHGMGYTYKYLGMDKIIEAYKQNMMMALNSINRIISKSNGSKIVISSDHSYNFDGTKTRIRKAYVPWLEIN